MADRVGRAGTLAVAAVGAVTAGWWALALWPLAADAPAWVVRTRAVCFGAAAGGLPDPSGWVALVVQPAVMLGMALAIWGDDVRRALRALPGRLALVALGALVVLGLAGAGHRFGGAGATPEAELPAAPAGEPARVDRPAPPLGLLDQHGEVLEWDRFRGRPVLVAFAFGHCETVCPLVVENARAARRGVQGSPVPALVVVTLDPWRDTPARLEHLARRWNLAEDEHVVSGDVVDVEAVLDGWGISRSRNLRTGEVVHVARVDVVDADGTIAWSTGGEPARLAELIGIL